MTIDLAKETTYPLTQAAGFVTPGRSGERTHLSTLLRWILKGCRGPSGETVRLEALRLGGKWVTSREALQRFADRLTPRFDATPQPSLRTLGQRQRASEAAAEELARMGV